MINLQVKLDGLKQNPLQCHHLLPRILPKCTELVVICEVPDSLDQISAFLGSLLGLPCQEQGAGG